MDQDFMVWLAFWLCVAAMIALASWAIHKISGPIPQDYAEEDANEYRGAWYE